MSAQPSADGPERHSRWRPETTRVGAPARAALQPSLFEATEDEPSFGALAGAVQRRALTAGAWVDVRRGWVSGSAALFERLRDGVGWKAERRQMYDRVVDVPRLSCHLAADVRWPEPLLGELKAALDAHYAAELREPFRTCGMGYYRDGRDSVAWHGDTVGRGATQDTMVAIVSVGTPRAFLLRPRAVLAPPGPTIRYDVGHGDLLVMGGSAQRTWEHAVPKSSKAVGPRISIQFRPRDVL